MFSYQPIHLMLQKEHFFLCMITVNRMSVGFIILQAFSKKETKKS